MPSTSVTSVVYEKEAEDKWVLAKVYKIGDTVKTSLLMAT